VLNAGTIPQLRCAAVCGAANNQLAVAADADRLAERDILYAPDYVANAGGVINIYEEAMGLSYDRDAAFARVQRIHRTMLEIFDIAEAKGITTAEAADHLAQDRIAAVAASKLRR
jgi:leucine dehydrogenase